MKNFVWISCLWLCVGCAYPLKQGYKVSGKQTLNEGEWKPWFNQDEQIFRTRIGFRDRQFSGLMVVKDTDDGYRFAFLTEVGMTMFDMEVGESFFTLHYCFEPLNRKGLLKILENDFRRLILRPDGEEVKVYEKGDENVYKWKPGGDKLFLRTSAQDLKEIFHPSVFPDKVKIEADYSSGELSKLNILHEKIKLSIELKPM